MADQDILQLLDVANEPLTTPQIAEHLGISKPATWKRLADLREAELVEKTQGRGLRGEVWSLSDEGRASLEDEAVAGRP